jgi:hypothetical protein
MNAIDEESIPPRGSSDESACEAALELKIVVMIR